MGVTFLPTDRESDILQLIEKNPMITQQELAYQLGITRSSVGVHVSRLIKQGLVQGRGYVLPGRNFAAVVGAAVLDIQGHPTKPLVQQDSNPGTVILSPGGVGRNIAHNLALLGQDVKFFSMFGGDSNGTLLADSCRNAGIDISPSPVIAGASSAVYLFITNHEGEMQLAVSDMKIYERMTPAFLQPQLALINQAALCYADTNLPEDTLCALANALRVPLFVDTVSTAKAIKLARILPHVHTLKTNRLEAALLCGFEITDEETLQKAVQTLLEKGVQRIFLTLGPQGVLCATATESLRLPIYSSKLVNSTGAGDSFAAALAYAWMQHLSLEDSAKAGLAAASLSITHPDTIHPGISTENLNRIIHGLAPLQ